MSLPSTYKSRNCERNSGNQVFVLLHYIMLQGLRPDEEVQKMVMNAMVNAVPTELVYNQSTGPAQFTNE